MRYLHLGILLTYIITVRAMDMLHMTYGWSQLDFQYPSEEMRESDIEGGDFKQANVLPMGLEVYKDRLFITTPRWKSGVPSTLNYVDLNDNSTMSPKLIPYPNWAAHRMDQAHSAELVSPFRARADRCGRLWVVDSGQVDILEPTPTTVPPTIVIYDLENDNLIKKYTIPQSQIKQDSFFANIAVEDFSCADTYAYIADVAKPGLIVYSLAQDESWRVTHHYFHPDPLAGQFNIRGINVTWEDAIFGLGLSAPRPDNFSTLYFHPMASYNEFAVSTEVLRNKSAGDESFHEFKLLGSRGPNAQSSVSFLDKETGVLFYSLVNLNAVACWQTNNKEYTLKSQGRIFMNNNSMIYPSDIKVDYEHRVWILSNRLPVFMYGTLDPTDVNFRVFSGSVVDAISHTACDIDPRVDILDKFASKMLPKSTTSDTPRTLPTLLSVAMFAFIAASF